MDGVTAGKHLPPPPELPVYGQVGTGRISFFGKTNYVAALEEKKFVFGIQRTDRQSPVYIVGRQGVGKSKLVELLARQDIAEGHAMCLVDPVGDLVTSLKVFADTAHTENVSVVHTDAIDLVAALITHAPEVFHRELAPLLADAVCRSTQMHFTPHAFHLLTYTFRVLIECPDPSLHAALRIITDASYRKTALTYVTDSAVRHFWEEHFPRFERRSEHSAILFAVHALTALVPDKRLSAVSDDVPLDPTLWVREKRTVLFSLARHKTGVSRSLFTELLIGSALTGYSASQTTNSGSQPLYAYFDGFGCGTAPLFTNLIADAPRAGVCLTFAHQFLGELHDRFFQTLTNSAGTIVAFRLNGEDALRLEQEFIPAVKARDFVTLAPRMCFVKMHINGVVSEPFSAEILSAQGSGSLG